MSRRVKLYQACAHFIMMDFVMPSDSRVLLFFYDLPQSACGELWFDLIKASNWYYYWTWLALIMSNFTLWVASNITRSYCSRSGIVSTIFDRNKWLCWVQKKNTQLHKQDDHNSLGVWMLLWLLKLGQALLFTLRTFIHILFISFYIRLLTPLSRHITWIILLLWSHLLTRSWDIY